VELITTEIKIRENKPQAEKIEPSTISSYGYSYLTTGDCGKPAP
jgi:hypothetical protein